MLHPAGQRPDELPRALLAEADHVDDDLSAEVGDRRAERTGILLGFPVDRHHRDVLPCTVEPVRPPSAPTDHDDVMALLDQTRDKVSADVSATTQYSDLHPAHASHA